MTSRLRCTEAILDATLKHLHEGGTRNCETVVLWVGRDGADEPRVVDVYKPQQTVAEDFFRVEVDSMRRLVQHLKVSRTKILAQVHSHPASAFHSAADDKWALVRHVGALSLVVPDFGANTTVKNFRSTVVVFQLRVDDIWHPEPFDRAISLEI